ncbi:MAG: response regulator transcription factor [Proteobacteria bacterium]|nr:response regulator transcription factor [Pseudomonadota bacterium]
MDISTDGLENGYGRLKSKPIKEINRVADVRPQPVDSKTRPDTASIIVIEGRSFVRNCIVTNLSESIALTGVGFPTAEDYLAKQNELQAAIIVICTMGGDERDAVAQLTKLKANGCRAPVVVMSDADKIELLIATMEAGGDGFMPADISLEVAAHALRLILAGGQYFPVTSLVAVRRAMSETQRPETCPTSMFTKRQIAVIDALRKGKANKIIAYELNMCESTVKVHVRNIMKKLNAKNRTEVAYLANELLCEHP